MIRHKDGTMTGTPAEMAEYERLQKGEKPKTHAEMLGESFRILDFNSKRNKCPNEGKPCFCTGACLGLKGTDIEHVYSGDVLESDTVSYHPTIADKNYIPNTAGGDNSIMKIMCDR